MVARLAGFSVPITLPGCIPDVLRADPACGAIFIGDAKATEHPSNEETYRRLSTYMQWFKVAVRGGGRGSVFALWLGELSDLPGWLAVLHGLAIDAGLTVYYVGARRISGSDTVVWIDLADRKVEGPPDEGWARRRQVGAQSPSLHHRATSTLPRQRHHAD